MGQIAELLAVGDLNTNSVLDASDKKYVTRKKDEIGMLARAFSKLIEGTIEQARAAELIADADLRADVNVRAQNDVLGKGLSKLAAKPELRWSRK